MFVLIILGYKGTGFEVGDTFVPVLGSIGAITKVGPTGQVYPSWCKVLDTDDLGFAGWTMDYEGVFNYSLIVAAMSGRTFIVDPECKNVQSLPLRGSDSYCEGVIVVPNNATRWGSLAGNIYVGCENSNHYSYSPTTKQWKKWTTFVTTDDLDFIPKNQNWFGMNWDAGKVLMNVVTENSTLEAQLLIGWAWMGISFTQLIRELWPLCIGTFQSKHPDL